MKYYIPSENETIEDAREFDGDDPEDAAEEYQSDSGGDCAAKWSMHPMIFAIVAEDGTEKGYKVYLDWSPDFTAYEEKPDAEKLMENQAKQAKTGAEKS